MLLKVSTRQRNLKTNAKKCCKTHNQYAVLRVIDIPKISSNKLSSSFIGKMDTATKAQRRSGWQQKRFKLHRRICQEDSPLMEVTRRKAWHANSQLTRNQKQKSAKASWHEPVKVDTTKSMPNLRKKRSRNRPIFKINARADEKTLTAAIMKLLTKISNSQGFVTKMQNNGKLFIRSIEKGK